MGRQAERKNRPKNAESLLRNGFPEKAFRTDSKLATDLWERQIRPQVVQIAWRSTRRSIEALSTEEPNITAGVRLPDGGSAAGARDVVHKRYAVGEVGAALVDVA